MSEKMTQARLKTMTKNEVIDFIRLEKGDLHFEFSGYETENGNCTIHNKKVLDVFAKYGIYNYTDYLFLDFYKGIPTLYLRYFQKDENLEFDFGGYTSSEIIYEVFNVDISESLVFNLPLIIVISPDISDNTIKVLSLNVLNVISIFCKSNIS